MSLANTSLHKPKNWQEFERSTRVLFECVLVDPNTQMNGRSGQPQNGVDIYGQRDNRDWVGVQCKKKTDENVSDSELRFEVENAKNFRPSISEFFIVTTAPRDQKIQETARLITEELSQTNHPIKVYVWGWDDIEENASMYDKAWKAFDPTWDPFVEKGFDNLNYEIREIRKILSGVCPSSMADNIKADDSNEETQLHGQITMLQKLINKGNIEPALQQLLELKNEKWENANASERYRILTSLASANHKLGLVDKAGQLIIDAYKEYPEHKDAVVNLATAYLLTKDCKYAASFAQGALEKDKLNSHFANILIQARIPDTSYDNPLDNISDELHETEEVLIALIHFHRSRGNRDWVDIAKHATEKYSQSSIIKVLYAEGILDMTIRMEQDAMSGGIFKIISSKDFNNAVDFLYSEACKAIKEYSEFLKTIVYNAALALRINNDYPKAKEILDKAIEKYPNDEDLCLQRAIIAHLENEPKDVLKFLPQDSENPEVISLRIGALIDTNSDQALALIEHTDDNKFPEHVKLGLLFDRLSLLIKKNRKQKAIDTISEKVMLEPNNLHYRILEVKTYRMIGNEQSAGESFDKALTLVSDTTDLHLRIELGFEAKRLNREDEIVDLLKDRVATSHDNEGLHMLIMALINSCRWFSCLEVLESISPEIKNINWIQRAEVILSLNTGDISTTEKVDIYLENYPHDLDIVLARIGIYQREGTNEAIKRFLQKIDLDKLEGIPEQHIRLAAIICYYQDAFKGLDYGYSILMNNWTTPRAHLAYQSLILLNDKIESFLSSCDAVKESTVVGIKSDSKEQRYRLENKQYSFFEHERVDSHNELYSLLIDKRVGEEIKIRNYVGGKSVKIIWIKSIYIDALHRSFEYFDEHFPNTEGVMRFNINSNSSDPLEDIRDVMKARAENGLHMLEMYNSKEIPLAFVAKLSGNDLIDTWKGLRGLNYKLLVCNGSSIERDEAQKIIKGNNKQGCVLDAITLSLIHHLGVEDAVTAVCGQMYIPQTVMDYLMSRYMVANQNIEKLSGVMSWHNNRLVYENYTKEYLVELALEREKEVIWAKKNTITSSIPKLDLSKENRIIRDKLGNDICDIAIVTSGNNYILLSEDMGYRRWASASFDISAIWLQPVLAVALAENHITNEKYYEVVNQLVYLGHTYVSLNSDCLMYQAEKNEFNVTIELSQLLEMVGGANADFITNTGVLGEFINKLCRECHDEFIIKRIISEIFRTFSIGRKEDLRTIAYYITNGATLKRRLIKNYSMEWLIGHSIGMPYFNDLLQLKG